MTLAETLNWMRANASSIDQLACGGDKLALKVVEAYRALYRNQMDVKLQDEYLRVCDEYVRRDLTKTERSELQERFGHKLRPDMH